MHEIKWEDIFDEYYPRDGATSEEIDKFISTTSMPLTNEELNTIRRSDTNPFRKSDPLYNSWSPIDPTKWKIPDRPFPASYLSLLRWNNGGDCRTGDRWFQFFPGDDSNDCVRAMMLGYFLPQWMPGSIPFAFNGGGVFYVFDMREPPADGEYPILCSSAGNLDYDDAVKIADNFLDACRGTENVELFLYG